MPRDDDYGEGMLDKPRRPARLEVPELREETRCPHCSIYIVKFRVALEEMEAERDALRERLAEAEGERDKWQRHYEMERHAGNVLQSDLTTVRGRLVEANLRFDYADQCCKSWHDLHGVRTVERDILAAKLAKVEQGILDLNADAPNLCWGNGEPYRIPEELKRG